jgi:hypothetical protein
MLMLVVLPNHVIRVLNWSFTAIVGKKWRRPNAGIGGFLVDSGTIQGLSTEYDNGNTLKECGGFLIVTEM